MIETKISVIRTIKDGTKTFRRWTMDELFRELRGERYCSVIRSYRENMPLIQREPAALRQSLTNEMLEEVPMLHFATEMHKTGGEEKVVRRNPLLLLFANNLRNAERAAELCDRAAMLPYTRLAFIGADSISVNIVCELRPLRMDISSDADYEKLLCKGFASLRKIYSDHLQTSLDTQKPELMSGCRMSYDRNVFYNPLSPCFHVDMLSVTPTPLDAEKHHIPRQLEDREEMYQWRRIYIDNLRKAQQMTFNENDSFETLLLLARYCHETGMPQALAVRYALLNSELSEDSILVRDTFDSEYEKELRQVNRNKHLSATAQMIMRTNNFLNVHFRFRRNVLNGIVEYRLNDGSDFNYHLLTTEAQNTMTIMALESGLNSWDKDLNRYIHSKRIPEYDPVNSFLDSLPRWDGTDRITALARRIPTDTPDWERNFHTWMLSMVAQWMGKDSQYGNAIAPILIGAQATGKSSFCRMLLPETLLPYYNDSIHFKDDKSVFLALSSFALINIDEFDSLSRSQQPLLKYLLSKTDVKYRAAYRNYIEQHKRYASFIGTTNKQRPLSDPTGSRRFICVHVMGAIDITTPLDHQQIYAQLREEVQNGERYWFTKEEADIITQQNAGYQRIADIRTIILSLFRIPEASDNATTLPLEDIIKTITTAYPELTSTTDINMKVGRLMKQIGFEQVRARIGRCYKVARVS